MDEIVNGPLSGSLSLPADSSTAPSKERSSVGESTCPTSGASRLGLLVVNADDWGRDHETTERTLDCVLRGAVSSVSAMVFMADSQRAAGIAKERAIDSGLHLNFTASFSATGIPTGLIKHQERVSRYLRRHRLAQAIFHPGLITSFEYVVCSQVDEFRRLYGALPERLDGHHHMHLCANVLLGGLLRGGTIVRRNFSFLPGEKGWANRYYRKTVDAMLARRHRLTDFFFSLPPLEPMRLRQIFADAQQFSVEVETHPISPAEYRFLAGGEIFRLIDGLQVASGFTLPQGADPTGYKDRKSDGNA